MKRNHYLVRGVLSPVIMPPSEKGLLTLFEKGKPGALVLGNNVTGRQGIDGRFTGHTGEIIQGDFPPAFELLETAVKEIGFSGFLALDAEGHGFGFLVVLFCGEKAI
jgi:hypothetical protein